MPEKVVVTGGCGFIGSHLVESLAEKNFDVVVFDNLSTGHLHNLGKVIDGVTLVKGDIRDYSETEKALKEAKIVFHLAALSYVGESMRIPEAYNHVNIDGTLNVLRACKSNSVQRYVFPSTCIVYGNPVVHPTPETSPLNPNSPYSLTKSVGEFYANFFHQEHGLEAICLRIFNAYGPRMQQRVISIFANSALQGRPISLNGSGNQERDFVFVSDIVEGFLCAMKAKERKCGHSYNIGTGKSTTLNDVIKKMDSLLGTNAKVEHKADVSNEIYRLVADTRLSKRELGFQSKVSFDAGLKKTLQALKKDFEKKKKMA